MSLRVNNFKNSNWFYYIKKKVINKFRQYSTNFDNYDEEKPSDTQNCRIRTFENGFRIATEDINKPICTIGLWIETGSRWETKALNGVAHFHERLILKGIPDLEAKLSKIGAVLLSYTTRETTGFYATCLPLQVPNMIEVFSDIINFHKFDEKVINSEREASLNEMTEYDNNYKKVVFDFLHSTAFQGTPLAQTTFGPREHVKKFTNKDIYEYKKENYRAPRMVISAAGLVCHDELCVLAQESFGGLESVGCSLDPCRFTGSEMRYRDDSIPQVYAAIAIESCPITDPDFFPLSVAAAIIGVYNHEPYGINHSSNLARASAEDSLCEHFHAFHINYSDTGLWGIYFQGNPLESENMVYNIQTEWMKFCTIVTQAEVERGKNYLKSYYARLLTGTDKFCINMGQQLMYSNHIMELPEILYTIDNVDKEAVKNACMKYVYDQCPAVACIGPVEAFPDYVRLRSGMYWLRI